jgi:carboxymethylenebutenolidase
MDAYLAAPEGNPRWGIVLAMSIWGVNSELRAVADAYAALGYLVLAPNLYWRHQPNHGIDFVQSEFNAVVDLMYKATDADALDDLEAARRVLAERYGVGCCAAIGWCYGGRIACVSASRGGFDAAIGYYPSLLETRLDITETLRCPVLLHLPEIEHYGTTEDSIERIVDAFAGHPQIRTFVYLGAEHGFDFGPTQNKYNHPAARLADMRSALFLHELSRDPR